MLCISLPKAMVASCLLLTAFFTWSIDLFPQLCKSSCVCASIFSSFELFDSHVSPFLPRLAAHPVLPVLYHLQASQGALYLIIRVIYEDVSQYQPHHLECTVHLMRPLLGASHNYKRDFKGSHLGSQ